MKLSKMKYSKIIFKRIIKRIIIYTVIFTVIFVFLLALGLSVTNQYIWQANDPMYIFLTNIRSNLLFIWSLGVLIILIYYLKKALSYIDYIISASENLVNQEAEYVDLPSALGMLEDHLNQIKHESMKNELLARTNEERKNELIVYLAHDLKTPLTSVIG